MAVVARLDTALSEFAGISRNQASLLIKSNFVSVNKKQTKKPSFALKIGDKVEFDLPQPQKCEFTPEFTNELSPEILYEDDDILVLNKPSGLVVHSAPSVKEKTLVDWLKARGCELATINGELRAGIVHRLDKGTSGAMVVAKNNAASANLSAQLAIKSMGRIYLALIDLPLKENCVIDRPIGRNVANRLKKAIIKGGREAKSAFASVELRGEFESEFRASLEANSDFSLNIENSSEIGVNSHLSVSKLANPKANLIACKLFSGRTHQIRVHLSSINRHILGDNLYGFKSNDSKIKRVMLHAYLLNLRHPRSGEEMSFVASLPDEFYDYLKITKENLYEKINPNALYAMFERVSTWLCYKTTD